MSGQQEVWSIDFKTWPLSVKDEFKNWVTLWEEDEKKEKKKIWRKPKVVKAS